MNCQHCHQNPTTHPSGYCKPCRVWIKWMQDENTAEVHRQDTLWFCRGCSAEWEAKATPSECPECGYGDVEKWTDRLERDAENRLDN